MNQGGTWPSDEFETKLGAFIPGDQTTLDLWGEAAVTQFLVNIWQIDACGHTVKADSELERILTICMSSPLPCIYYDAEKVLEHRLSEMLEDFNPQFDPKDDARHSWVARILMLHMAQRDMKSVCQKLWPEFTKITSTVFLPEKRWMYCLLHSELGNNMQYVPKMPETWEALKKESSEEVKNYVPAPLLDRPWLLTLWTLAVPQRAIPPVIGHVSTALGRRSKQSERPAQENSVSKFFGKGKRRSTMWSASGSGGPY